jgi:hypothetical protein
MHSDVQWGNLKTKEPLGIYRYRYEDGIKIDTEEIRCEGVNWIYVAQYGD